MATLSKVLFVNGPRGKMTSQQKTICLPLLRDEIVEGLSRHDMHEMFFSPSQTVGSWKED